MQMVRGQKRRGWLVIAFMAIAVALLLLLALHGQTGAPDFIAILPLLVAGVLSPLTLLAVLLDGYTSRPPQAPVLAAAFERPPPSLLR